MITFLGWLTFVFGGAYLAGGITAVITLLIMRDGFETFAPAIVMAGIAAMCWITFAVWMSPITIIV